MKSLFYGFTYNGYYPFTVYKELFILHFNKKFLYDDDI